MRLSCGKTEFFHLKDVSFFYQRGLHMDKDGVTAFKQLVESAPILFYVADKNLKFTYINPFFS